MGSDGRCVQCRYERQTCSQCKTKVDEAVFRVGVVMCKSCSGASVPPPKYGGVE